MQKCPELTFGFLCFGLQDFQDSSLEVLLKNYADGTQTHSYIAWCLDERVSNLFSSALLHITIRRVTSPSASLRGQVNTRDRTARNLKL